MSVTKDEEMVFGCSAICGAVTCAVGAGAYGALTKGFLVGCLMTFLGAVGGAVFGLFGIGVPILSVAAWWRMWKQRRS